MHKHQLQSCVFGDYITRSGNLSRHMRKQHLPFATMTNNYARQHYEEEHPSLNAWEIQALMARDWHLGRCMGLTSSGVWTRERQLESEREWKRMAERPASDTLTESSGSSNKLGLLSNSIVETME